MSPAQICPRLWPGSTITILASGPSLTDADVAEVHRHQATGKIVTIAINTTVRKAPWADVLYACDLKWWRNNPEAIKFPGLKFGLREAGSADAIAGVRFLQYREPRIVGLERDPSYLATGANSGYQAINLAAHLGAARILLLGFDCGTDEAGNRHWHGDHPAPLMNPDESLFQKWRAAFDTLPPALAGVGVEVVNCSRSTTITAFQRSDISTALRSI